MEDSKYEDQKFKQWLADNHWFPYGPTDDRNPLKGTVAEQWVYQGKGRARHATTSDLYKLFEAEQTKDDE